MYMNELYNSIMYMKLFAYIYMYIAKSWRTVCNFVQFYEDGQKFIASGESNFKHNSFNSKLNAGRSLKPAHISFTDIILFEQKDHFWIENSFILNKSKIGIDFAFYKINRNSTYLGLPKNGFNNWLFFYVNHYFSKRGAIRLRP